MSVFATLKAQAAAIIGTLALVLVLSLGGYAWHLAGKVERQQELLGELRGTLSRYESTLTELQATQVAQQAAIEAATRANARKRQATEQAVRQVLTQPIPETTSPEEWATEQLKGRPW